MRNLRRLVMALLLAAISLAVGVFPVVATFRPIH